MTRHHHRWTTLLNDNPLVTLDGGLATELERAGASLDHPLWSGQILRTQPELIQQCHQSYFEAGAQVATTASYQLTSEGMQRAGLDPNEFESLVTLSADLARAAAADRGLVAGSIGPYGAMLNDGSEYTGSYPMDKDVLRRFHAPRIVGLAAGGVDVIALETFPSLAEARVAAEAVGELTDLQCWVSFTCRDGEQTAYGDPLEGCVTALESLPQVAALGVNCVSPEVAIDATRTLARSSEMPIIAYPNSGEKYDAAQSSWKDDRSTMSAGEIATGLMTAGARIIGGCCRTTPPWIAEAHAKLNAASA